MDDTLYELALKCLTFIVVSGGVMFGLIFGITIFKKPEATGLLPADRVVKLSVVLVLIFAFLMAFLASEGEMSS